MVVCVGAIVCRIFLDLGQVVLLADVGGLGAVETLDGTGWRVSLGDGSGCVERTRGGVCGESALVVRRRTVCQLPYCGGVNSSDLMYMC